MCVCVSPLLRVHLSRGSSVGSVARLQLSAALMDHMAGSVGFIRLKGAEIINSTQMCLQLRTVQFIFAYKLIKAHLSCSTLRSGLLCYWKLLIKVLLAAIIRSTCVFLTV